MKKLIVSLLLIVVTVLSGCFGAPSFYFFKESDMNNIERIELVYYTNENYKIVDPTEVALKFDPSKAEVVEVLAEDKVDAFLTEFEKIEFHRKDRSVDEPTGYCLLWHLKNGNYIVFSCTLFESERIGYSMVAEFDSSNAFVCHIGFFAAKPHFDLIVGDFFEQYDI